MRTPRLAILVLFIFVCLFVLVRSVTSSARANAFPYPAKPKTPKSVMGFMYYNTPFSLFPPNAAISLTDDNSTTFVARPAAFGPKLAAKGLSGELWVGNGFPEDTRDGNGELGCGDLVGWDGRSAQTSLKSSFRTTARSAEARDTFAKRSDQLLDPDNRAISKARSRLADPVVDDGTDDYLHAGLANSARDSHADIQSIQETAEIKGKVVLLMRGGCGFLKKVMWAQRRGAVAVIVGDNQKGGPLVQMFAHGDEVENVTIPSVFTARTTAHILSSLTQPGSFIEDIVDDNGNSILRVQKNTKPTQKGDKVQKNGQTASAKTTGSSGTSSTSYKEKKITQTTGKSGVTRPYKRSWLSRLFDFKRMPRGMDAKGRPSSGDHLDWVLTEDWSEEKDKIIKDSIKLPGDDTEQHSGAPKSKQDHGSTSKNGDSLKHKRSNASNKDNVGKRAGSAQNQAGNSAGKSRDVISRLVGDDEEDLLLVDTLVDSSDDEDTNTPEPVTRPHDGLWVTITPTSSASPFFDTLLVLVISPLVTLTVVYALLLLRARIRRRRWRAPKSVVERLPVRTYQAVAPSPSRSPTRSPRLPSPTSASPTTPLLQQSPTRSRPRSRTTNAALETESFLAPNTPVQTPQATTRSSPREHEKGSSGFSGEWRKYMGRQVECVVCLEEYVDGVSRVMSLPCGHEFHVDCITPWLTTRRRTCPICKGDVVKSMAHGSSSGPRYEPYHDDSDDEPDAEASSSRSADRDSDLEHGILSPEPRESRRANLQEGWLRLFSGSLGSRARSPSVNADERDR